MFLLDTLYRKENETTTENCRETLHKLCGKSYVNCMFVVCKEIEALTVDFPSF